LGDLTGDEAAALGVLINKVARALNDLDREVSGPVAESMQEVC
jgi:hypothetical protein